VTLDNHGKLPDVVLYCPDRKWLFLIESVTSHGPVEPKRRHELDAGRVKDFETTWWRI